MDNAIPNGAGEIQTGLIEQASQAYFGWISLLGKIQELNMTLPYTSISR